MNMIFREQNYVQICFYFLLLKTMVLKNEYIKLL